ncbi:hypothetical protein PYW08_002273 [Mythimna loreyi]|uniref:Uncharacterized protein n=1 Tax=Mythimna loreyi TaxID=667449 RepID=A0ACC2R187_9NEOP|nr:hypothetical protein PYW08_002273 [Mythimna loreyi]
MGKILMLVLIATAAVAIARRDVRSPGGSGWQRSSGFGGGPSAGFSRSSGGGWTGSGNNLGRSFGSGGWQFGSSTRGRSPSSSGWSQSGCSSNGAYGGNSFRSPGWNDRFADSTVIESLDSSNEPYNQGLRSNNGWQSSAW